MQKTIHLFMVLKHVHKGTDQGHYCQYNEKSAHPVTMNKLQSKL